MREVISLHIGQAGVQIGNSCWELYCLEHGIQPDGQMPSNWTISGGDESFRTFFSETIGGKLVPRAVFLDLEPNSIENAYTSTYRQLFDPDQLVWGKEDASNIFARGLRPGQAFMDSSLNSIRQLAQRCSSLQGFIFFHSLGGGTGSGFTSRLMEQLRIDYKKKDIIDIAIEPSKHMSSAVVEPYNSILATSDSIDNDSICTILLDNEAMCNICRNNLKVLQPGYTNVNYLMAQCVSSLTTGLRFGGIRKRDLNDIISKLVPYPRIHYATASYAPVTSTKQINEDHMSVRDITGACFDPSNQMLKCDPTLGKYMACCVLCRGAEKIEVHNGINSVKQNRDIQSVNWNPDPYAVDSSLRRPTAMPGSGFAEVKHDVFMLSNTTAIAETWARSGHSFDLMFRKRAFLHWYEREGMSKDEFLTARQNVLRLEEAYKDGVEGDQHEDFRAQTLA